MLDDLPIVVEAEYVDAGPVVFAGPSLMAMQDHQISFGDGALEIDSAPTGSLRLKKQLVEFLGVTLVLLELGVHRKQLLP